MNKENDLIVSIKKRKLQYFGDGMRGQHVFRATADHAGQNRREEVSGEKKDVLLKKLLREWAGRLYIYNTTLSKIKIAVMVAYLRYEKASKEGDTSHFADIFSFLKAFGLFV